MAILFITEYAELALAGPGRSAQLGAEPPLVEQTVAITGGHLESAQLNAKTRLIRLHCDVICSVLVTLVGSGLFATATSGRMAASQTEYRGIPPKLAMVVSVVSNV